MSVFSRLSAPLQSSQVAGSPSLPVFSSTARAKLIAWLWVFPWPLHGIPVGKLWSQWGHLQHESPGQTRWSLGNMLFCTLSLAKYGTSALWKDSKISPETQDLGKSSFLQERMMILQVHLGASVSSVSCEQPALWAQGSAHTRLSTAPTGVREKIPFDNGNQIGPNAKAHSWTRCHLAPINGHLQCWISTQLSVSALWKKIKKVQTKHQTSSNKNVVPSCIFLHVFSSPVLQGEFNIGNYLLPLWVLVFFCQFYLYILVMIYSREN